jgi:hypothetical protein
VWTESREGGWWLNAKNLEGILTSDSHEVLQDIIPNILQEKRSAETGNTQARDFLGLVELPKW